MDFFYLLSQRQQASTKTKYWYIYYVQACMYVLRMYIHTVPYSTVQYSAYMASQLINSVKVADRSLRHQSLRQPFSSVDDFNTD